MTITRVQQTHNLSFGLSEKNGPEKAGRVEQSSFKLTFDQFYNERSPGAMPIYKKTVIPIVDTGYLGNKSEPAQQASKLEPGAGNAAVATQEDNVRNASTSKHSGGSDVINAEKEIGFLDLLDIINPLQHLPIIGNIYRAVTGDGIGPVAKIIGDSIYGGPIGAVAGMVTTVLEHKDYDAAQNVSAKGATSQAFSDSTV